jgi:hypothetical protein
MGIDLHLSTCVDTQSPKYLEMAQRHISLSVIYDYTLLSPCNCDFTLYFLFLITNSDFY